jgi:hypothetical protein
MSLAFSRGPRVEHIVRGQSGVSGEVSKLRKDVSDAFDVIEVGSIHMMKFTGPSSGLALTAGIKAAFASAATPVTLTGTDFDGVLAPGTGAAIINTPKKVTLIVAGSGTPADWLGGTVEFTGTDSDGNVLVEDVVSAAGAGTTTTTHYFASITQVALPVATSTGASLTLGVAADTASIATFTSDTVAQVIDGTDNTKFNRTRKGNRALRYARRISFIFNSHADWDATTIVVRGRDVRGNQISSNILVANGGGTTVTTDKFFKSIERVTIPAQSGTNGTVAVAPFETSLGLDLDAISDVEAVAVVREASRADSASAWSVPTAGAVDDSSVANALPYGAYTPHSSVPMNGVREYVLTYIPKAA